MILLVVLAILAYFGYATYRNRSLSDADETTMRQYTTILPKVDDADEDEDTTLPLDRIGSSFESLDWLNQITRVCWPYIGKIVEKELGPTAEPMINMALPTPFKNFRFLHAKLGKDYLVVDRVTVHKRNKTSVTLDLDVSFKGKPDITMSVSPVPTPFGIEELRWHGRLSVLLKPLVPVLPCVGAVQAAFITHPDLEIEFSGVAAIADFGPIEKIVNNVLHDVIAGMFVLPNRFLMKLNDAIDYFKVVRISRPAYVPRKARRGMNRPGARPLVHPRIFANKIRDAFFSVDTPSNDALFTRGRVLLDHGSVVPGVVLAPSAREYLVRSSARCNPNLCRPRPGFPEGTQGQTHQADPGLLRSCEVWAKESTDTLRPEVLDSCMELFPIVCRLERGTATCPASV